MRLFVALTLAVLLAACASAPFTVDDGRAVNEELLTSIRRFGAAEQALRPAIVRTALLKDPACDHQWELPFAVASSDDLAADDRVAWVRTLGVDEQAMSAMQQAATNCGLLTGIARVAATVFDRADAWAYIRMQRLNGDPLAGFSLHQKLVEQRLTDNAMVLGPQRMAALSKLAEKSGRSDDVTAILGGLKPEQLQVAMLEMPLASAPAGFSYDEITSGAPAGTPATLGLIDTMLHMSVASGSAH